MNLTGFLAAGEIAMIPCYLLLWLRCGIALVSALAFVAVVTAQETAPRPGAALVKALRQGGYVLVMRHTATHDDQADTDPLHFDNIAQQRHLNDEGRAQARSIGEAIRRLGIPIASVTTSLFFRTQETGKLLNVAPVTTSIDLTEGCFVISPRENQRRMQAMLAMLATMPAAGKNVVLVSHKPNIVEVFGHGVLDAQEGESFIVQPDGAGNFELVARIKAEEWKSLTAAP
jgi:phosphohistidine phosphatase SixA